MAVVPFERIEHLSDDDEDLSDDDEPLDLISLFEINFDMFILKLEELKQTLTQEEFYWLVNADSRSNNKFYNTNKIWDSPMTMWVLWAVGDHFDRTESEKQWTWILPTGRMEGISAEEGFKMFKFLVDNGANCTKKNGYEETVVSLINSSVEENKINYVSRQGEEYDELVRLIQQEYPETRQQLVVISDCFEDSAE